MPVLVEMRILQGPLLAGNREYSMLRAGTPLDEARCRGGSSFIHLGVGAWIKQARKWLEWVDYLFESANVYQLEEDACTLARFWCRLYQFLAVGTIDTQSLGQARKHGRYAHPATLCVQPSPLGH